MFYSSTKESETNHSYEKVEIPFKLSTEEAGEGIAFDDSIIDWISFGENREYSGNIFSPTTSYDTPWVSNGEFVKLFDDGVFSSASINSQKDFSFEIDTDTEAKYYVLYLGGFKSTAKVTVRDSAGNVQTVNFGNIDGSYTKRVIIEKADNSTGKLYITYSLATIE